MAHAVQEYEFGAVLNDYSIESINSSVDCLINCDFSQLSENAYLFAQAHAWEEQEKVMLEGYHRMLTQ